MAQESTNDLINAVMQAESRGQRYTDGKLTTSPKGAQGEMQVMPKTQRAPGFGVKPAQNDSPEEIARVGKDYLQALVKKFGDTDTALIAYNWGPGNTNKWLAAGADPSKLPKETQNYVARVNRNLTGTPSTTSTQVAQKPTTPAPSTTQPTAQAQPPAKAMRVSLEGGVQHPILAQLGPSYQAALALSMLADEGEKEGKSETEDNESEKMLKEYMASEARPVALASVDLGYQSPFPQEQPVVKMADGGDPADYFQDPLGAPSAPITADTFAKGKDFKAADALRAMKEVGTGVAKTGKAIVQGVSETPYNLVGAPVDIATMVMRPFGYNVEAPVGGSDWLKKQALEAGIRQAPPEDERMRGFYTMGELGAGLVNPGPIAAKVGQATEKAVTTGGKAVAREMFRGLEGEGVLAPVSPQGAIMYAVKPRGGPFVGLQPSGGQFIDSVEELMRSGELMPELRSDLKIPMQSRKALNQWVEDKVGRYIRTDMATENDPFVKATDQGKKLHLHAGIDEAPSPMSVEHIRATEGFPKQGFAKTELGQKVEAQIDSSIWPQTVGDMDTYEMHPSMLKFKDTQPEKRIYQVGARLAERMQFPEMIQSMEDMLAQRKYSAYGEIAATIPEEYHLTPEKLQGLSPVQASEKVALFNQWRDNERQKQAADFLSRHGNTYKKYDNGRKWIAMDDLADEPKQAELVQQAGCLGGWCTKEESFAMENGSGDNRLHILFDEKAVPRVQLTVTKTTPTPDDFIMQLSQPELDAFEKAHGSTNYITSFDIKNTPEYLKWEREFANHGQERITELKGQFNRQNLVTDPSSHKYLKEVQDFVKSKPWAAVANLDGINMVDLDAYLPTISRGLNREQTNQLREYMKSLNNGSMYADKHEAENILRETSLRLFRPLSPPGHATGGMVERQTSTARYI